jgi:tRNA-specific 2-thiouridylase
MTRYRQAAAACMLLRAEGGALSVEFDAPQWAVTPGQSVVLYDAEVCLGGAIISRSHGTARASVEPALRAVG